MAAVANQGSRSGLITATVVLAFLFVLSAILAIYFYADANKAQTAMQTLQNQYHEVLDVSALSGPAVQNLRDQRGTADQFNGYGGSVNGQTDLLDVALAQRDYLGSLIAPGSSDQAITSAKAAIAQAAAAAKGAGGTLAAATLSDAVRGLSTVLAAKQTEVAALSSQLMKANAALKTEVATAQGQLDTVMKELAAARGQTTQADQRASELGTDHAKRVQELQTQLDQMLKASQDAQQKLQAQITDLTRRGAEATKQLGELRNKLAALRPDVNGPMLRQVDGHVVRVEPNGSTVFIDRGAGEQMTPGMTFEVFDKGQGLPVPGDTQSDDNLPKGKGSIEVVRVGPTSSECRIVHQQPGQAISEGDDIANLVYDVNTKYKFFVFGNFDLAHTGKSNPQDAAAIKRLITQWGGEVVNQVNVDTDFVVLGAEPVINAYTQEQLEDPLIKDKYEHEQQEATAYDTVRNKALDLRIPILNQNRFLYLVGYYEMASRIDTR